MKLTEFKQHLIKGNLNNFYIFVGSEIGIINMYLQEMSNKLNLDVAREDSVARVLAKARTKTMFGKKGKIYVVRGDKDFTGSPNHYDVVKELKDDYLIMLFDKLDSRLKFTKHFSDNIVEFEKLSDTILKKYIKKEIDLSDKCCEDLILSASGNYDIIMLEIDKIKNYAEIKKISEEQSFKHLLGCGCISQAKDYDVFKFTDAFCNRNIKQAIEISSILNENGGSSINMLGTLYNSLKTIMLIQLCNGQDVANTTGLDNGQIYFNRKYVGKYPIDVLVNGIKEINEDIEKIKYGKLNDLDAVKYCLANILK